MEKFTPLRSPDIISLEEVFTPASIPEKTFVERPEVGMRLETHLRSKGRPICLVGPYRSGKTSLALVTTQRFFQGHIHVVCKTTSTFEDLLLDAFDALSPYYDRERSEKNTRLPAGISADFFGIKGQIGGKGAELVKREQRVLPPQLTPRTLANFSAAADAPWIVDDIHKLSKEDLSKVAEVMREWQTLVLEVGTPKMIVIGSDHFSSSLPDKLIEAAPDLSQRLVSITLSLMSPPELRQIVQKGAALLNADFSLVTEDIIRYSFGFPGVCQDLCYHTCRAAGLDSSGPEPIQLKVTHLQKALQEYVEVCAPSIRRAFSDLYVLRNPSLPPNFVKVSLDIVAAGELEGRKTDDLIKEVSQSLGLDREETTKGLSHLTDEDRGVLRVESENLHFKEPMYLVYYRHSNAVASKEAAKTALASKFLEIIARA